MIKGQGKPPKLKTKGAETRSLISYGLQAAIAMHAQQQSVHSLTVLKCISSLLDFYMLVSLEVWQPLLASRACQQCVSFYKALSDEAKAPPISDDSLWRMKPKTHMFQELAEYQGFVLGNPRLFWNYMDEDFVGFIATIAMSRGGPKMAATTASNVLQQYRALAN